MLSSAPPQGRNHPNSGLNVEILDFIGVILSNQNAAEHHALLRRLLAFLQVVIQIGDALSGDGLRLQHHGCLQGAGFHGVALIVAAVDADDDHIATVGRFQRRNRAKGYRPVATDDAFHVGVRLQDAVHDAFAVDQGCLWHPVSPR